MDALTLIVLIVAALALLRGTLRPMPPQIVYVQPAPSAPSGGLGCLLAVAMFLLLLVLMGIVRI